ncbi:armadillo-type protein, partial [Mycena leptocephala]
MPPLTRQVSPQSIHSDWTDSRPTGPTINIHALAKLLMRPMYHQQVSKYMKKDRGLPLSRENIEIYKHVGTSTKAKILRCIAKKKISDDDACEVAHLFLLDSVVMDQFLQARDDRMQINACDVLRNLALHTSSAPIILQLNPCGRLVSLLRGKNPTLTVRALQVLHRISESKNGGEAVIQAGTLYLLDELFSSADTAVRIATCKVVRSLAFEEETSDSVIRANPSGALVSLLREQDPEVRREASLVLTWIAHWADGAKAVIDARALDEILKLPTQLPMCWFFESLSRMNQRR